jgi:hypothetical protein
MVRDSIWQQTQDPNLKPYANWDEFGKNLLHPESLENFIMAYSRDQILLQFADQGKTLTDWNNLENSINDVESSEYATALRGAARAAIGNAGFMLDDQGFQDIDFWIGGLAEAKVTGGMLGSTFDFLFAMQMVALQNADRFYYLGRLAGTDMLAEIETQFFSDIIMRNTGATHLYADIFSVADANVEIKDYTTGEFATYSSLVRATNAVTDVLGTSRNVGQAGYVGNVFYGNPGDYLDARGVFSPNGKGNASEMLGGTDAANNIDALGGNDTVWGDKGNDTIEGGLGNDFLHGGDDNDTITDSQGDDFIWGEAGQDDIHGGAGLDQIFGGTENDIIRGGAGADIIDGGDGDDVIYGDNGGITTTIFAGRTIEVMDRTGDDDLIAGESDIRRESIDDLDKSFCVDEFY